MGRTRGRTTSSSGGGLFGRSKPAAAPPARGMAMSRPASTATRPAAAPQQRNTTAPAPAATAAAPPPVHHTPSSGGGMLSGIGSTIVQGMAFGTGSAIAHRAVGAVAESFSGRGEEAPAAAEAPAQPAAMPMRGAGGDPCLMQAQQFQACLDQNSGNLSACQHMYDALRECKLYGAGAQ